MTPTATKKTPPAAVEPPSFASIARKKMRARIEEYRALLKRHADGETLTEADLSHVVDLLEGMGLPDFTWSRDCEASRRFAMVSGKYKVAVDAEPANRLRCEDLAKEVEVTQTKLRVLLEELRKAQSAAAKSVAYGHTLAELATAHPHAVADIDTAVTLRLDELNRRKREGVS